MSNIVLQYFDHRHKTVWNGRETKEIAKRLYWILFNFKKAKAIQLPLCALLDEFYLEQSENFLVFSKSFSVSGWWLVSGWSDCLVGYFEFISWVAFKAKKAKKSVLMIYFFQEWVKDSNLGHLKLFPQYFGIIFFILHHSIDLIILFNLIKSQIKWILFFQTDLSIFLYLRKILL